MADYTRADLEQNEAIKNLSKRCDVLQYHIEVLERKMGAVDRKFGELAPLADLVEFVESIKAQFANLRLK